MTLVIKWDSLKAVRHKATFAKTIVGVRVLVETYQGQDENPCRIEMGNLDSMVKALTNPAGKYRLCVLAPQHLEDTIRAHFADQFNLDTFPDLETVAGRPELPDESLTELLNRSTQYGPPTPPDEPQSADQRPLGHSLHPVFQDAMRPFLGGHRHV